MKLFFVMGFGLMLGVANIAHAEPAEADLCATSFAERLDKTFPFLKRYAKQIDYAMAEGFFVQHCRFLTKLERTVRKLDDPSAYVCEPGAKEPKELSEAVRVGSKEGWFGSGLTWQQAFVDAHADLQRANEECAQSDAAQRVSLVLPAVDMQMPGLDEDGERTEIRAWKRAVIEWQKAWTKVMQYMLAERKSRPKQARGELR
jgi:hypothetical protein